MENLGTLHLVATPIGNLQDLSSRAIETLKSVEYVLAEDPRQTLKIFHHFGIEKKLVAFTDHASEVKINRVLEELENGDIALVSDAGTPGVSDPGAHLVDAVLEAGGQVTPIPGPSAVTAMISVFGKSSPSFHFWGFFPRKTKVQKQILGYFQDVPGIHVIFESPYRVLKLFEKYLNALEGYHVVVGREMTKKFETFTRGTPTEVYENLKENPLKGEFCIAIRKETQAKVDI